MTPEERARIDIDRQLTLAGWQVQDCSSRRLGAALGVAIREFPLTTGRADYLLFVNRKVIGVVEAKPVGHTLIGVEGQTAKYSAGLPHRVKAWHDPLPFLYQSSSIETRFTNLLDPEPRSRDVFTFHRPETLLRWVKETSTLRARLRMMPPLVRGRLWPVQVQTIQNLECSLAQDKPRALVHMATGSGKTFVAVSQVYRLIKHAKAERVLFLVDRTNLGLQAEAAFKQYETPDDGRLFTELYNVQHLRGNKLDKASKVVIATIQRVYSMLKNEELDSEEALAWEQQEETVPRTVSYHPELPPSTFDFVIIDESHRSIYNLWREVLDYFDAYLIGLTATPSLHTYAFFHQNLVQEYTRQNAVADGINVDGWVYKIRTSITEGGSQIDAGEVVEKRDRLTRESRWEALDEELVYGDRQLDREVVAPNQIRLIVRTLKEKLQQELFPTRTLVPKTLIFAKDDAHAEIITQIVREEFGKGNDFCQKITYKVTGTSPDTLIKAFRNSTNPRVAVTVDMIATGTDIKALEVLVFMRRVKSALLFEQMLGRGTRIISTDDLQAVSGEEAQSKDFFVIVDTVGVVEHPKVSTQTMNRKRSVSFKKLLERVTDGDWEEDTLLTLAGRLGRLGRTLTPEDDTAVKAVSGGMSVPDLANLFLDGLDLDRALAVAQEATGEKLPDDSALNEAEEALRSHAAILIADNPALRETLMRVHARNEMVIDELSADHLLEAGLDQSATEMARQTVQAFEGYLEEYKDEIAALQILYERPQRAQDLTFQHVKELADRLYTPPRRWTSETLWHAYAKLDASKVRNGSPRVLTDLVALVRHVVGYDEVLVPYPQQVQQRYEAWLSQQEVSRGRFSSEQLAWLDRIASQIGVSVVVEPRDLDDLFYDKGGRFGAKRVLGKGWVKVLSEMNEALAA